MSCMLVLARFACLPVSALSGSNVLDAVSRMLQSKESLSLDDMDVAFTTFVQDPSIVMKQPTTSNDRG